MSKRAGFELSTRLGFQKIRIVISACVNFYGGDTKPDFVQKAMAPSPIEERVNGLLLLNVHRRC